MLQSCGTLRLRQVESSKAGVLRAGDVAPVELPTTVEVLASEAIVDGWSGPGTDRGIWRGIDSARVANPLPARPASRGSPALPSRPT